MPLRGRPFRSRFRQTPVSWKPPLTLGRQRSVTLVRWVLLLVLGSLVGCGADSSRSEPPGGSQAAADCDVLVRYGERIYSAFSPAVGARASATWLDLPGVVEVSECDDTGASARGAYFPADAATHQAVALPGIAPEQAVGYRVELQNRTVVVLATTETLKPADREAIGDRFLRQLR
jgi:hypothetical protein